MRVTKSNARRNERGVSLAVVALVIVMVLSMSAIAIDYGMIKTAKAEAQRAMDASALAGASAFTDPTPGFNYDSAAKRRAKEIAVLHTVHQVVVDTSAAAAKLAVTVDLANKNVKAAYTVPPMSLWFARTFGVNTMGLKAAATAHAENTSLATCPKPVAIPDSWDNGNTPAEDLNTDRIWNSKDKAGGTTGVWDEGETEPWIFNGTDRYDSLSTGWGSTFRDNLGTGVNHRTKDFGRQILLMTFSPKDNSVSSFYYTWGQTNNDNSASRLVQRILGECESASVQTTYPAANGTKSGPVSDAWDQLIAKDANATWVDDGSGGGTVTGSSKGANWLDQSPRVITVAMFNPSVYSRGPSWNQLQFNNMARIFLDKRPCGNGNGVCKQPLTGHFLGLLAGGGPGGNPSGSLVKRLVLIK